MSDAALAMDSAPRLTILDLGKGRHLFHRIGDPRVEVAPVAGAADRDPPDLVVFSSQKRADITDALGAVEPDFWRKARSARSGIVFDASGEGWPYTAEDADLLHEVLDEIGIGPERAVLVTQNRCVGPEYRRRCAKLGRAPIAVMNYDYWIRRLFLRHEGNGPLLFHRRKKRFKSAPHTRSRRFVSLNLTPRHTKVLVLLKLLADGLWDDGYISFGGFLGPHSSAAPGLSRMRRRLLNDPDFGALGAELEPWLDRLNALGQTLFAQGPPGQVDGALKVALAADAALEQYYYFWFSIITESEMLDRPARITEKPFSALLNFQPIIVFGNPGSLALIRSLGFQTFAGPIDESYDEEPDPRRRFDMAYAEVTRLCRMDEAELWAMRAALARPLMHNAEWGLTQLPAIYRDRIDVELVDQVMAAVRR